jgi:class 3 adenylate cyclase/tetratricopeptide (TPR) repeat protein
VTDELVAILFTDVEGSTALHAARGDAEARAILRVCEEAVRQQVQQHGGREVKSLGDGFMVAFGSPLRALACAVAVQQAVEEEGRRRPDRAMRVRIGLHAGMVSEEAGDLYGGAVNAAARIAARAKGGEVLVSDVIRQLCGTAADVAFRDRGALKLRGFPERWRLYEAVPQVRGTPVGERTPFVGRETERAELRRLMERAAAGEGGLVMIGGEPGVGKTRVTQEIANEARRRFQVFVGHCYEAQGNVPYMPWVEMLQTAVRDTAPETLRQALGDEAPELARLLPELRRVLPDIPPPLELPPDQQRRYTFNCLREYVARTSRVRPRLYILEDLHWADESTLLLLEHLAERLPTIPCLVVATYRDPPMDVSPQLAETLSALVRRRQARLLSLTRHSEVEVEGLLRALSGQSPPQAVRAVIYGETEGNAFFVEEVFRHLAESGRLLDERGCFRGDVAVGELDVPANVRLVTGQRLKRLSETTQRTLSIAAVAGRHIGFELLEAVAGVQGDDLIDVLDEAERARLIVTETEGPQEEYWFAHELIRQTLLTRLPAARRRRHHLRVADALERVFSDDLQAQAATIAQHLIEAGASADRARLFRYLVLAGRRALDSAAFEDALRHFERASSLTEAADPAQAIQLLVDLAMARRSLGRFEEALATWQEARDAHDTVGDAEGVAQACFEASQDLYWVNRDEEAFALAQQGVRALGHRVTFRRVRMLAWVGAAGAWVTPYEVGADIIDEALSLADQLGDQRLRAHALASKALHRFAFFRHRETVEAGQEATDLLRSAGELWETGTMLGFVEAALVELGRFARAAEVGQELATLAERLGHHFALFVHCMAEGQRAFAVSADLDQFGTFAQHNLEISGDMGYKGMGCGWLGVVEFLRGDWDAALALTEEGTRNEPPHNHGLQGMEWGPFFQTLAYRGERARALAVLDQKRRYLPTSARANPWGSWHLLLSVIEGLYVLEERKGAAALYPVVAEFATTGVVLTLFQGALVERVAGIAAAAGEQWDVAEAHFRTAFRQAEDLPHRLEQAETRRFHAQMLFDRGAPGDAEAAGRLLADAVEEYRRIGMPRHEELARTLSGA